MGPYPSIPSCFCNANYIRRAHATRNLTALMLLPCMGKGIDPYKDEAQVQSGFKWHGHCVCKMKCRSIGHWLLLSIGQQV